MNWMKRSLTQIAKPARGFESNAVVTNQKEVMLSRMTAGHVSEGTQGLQLLFGASLNGVQEKKVYGC